MAMILATTACRSIARACRSGALFTGKNGNVQTRTFCDVSIAVAAAGTEAKPTAPSPPRPVPVTTWETIVIGEIVNLHRHPEADRLNVCQVNVGDPENLLQIICGAPNARQGARVPVAKIGTKLAIKEETTGDIKQLKIKKSKLRGELSQGMICSEAELGLANQSDGILILDEDAPVGTLIQDWHEVGFRLVKEEPKSDEL